MKTEKTTHERHIYPKKSCVLFLFLTLILTILPSTVCAHSPSTQTISYNLETQELRFTITHQVSDPTTHYIQTVQIKKNGAIYNTSTYAEQPSASSFTYTYFINATAGDTIEVTTSCNQGGAKTTQYTIPTDNTDNGKNDTSTPDFELLIFIFALCTSIILVRKKNY